MGLLLSLHRRVPLFRAVSLTLRRGRVRAKVVGRSITLERLVRLLPVTPCWRVVLVMSGYIHGFVLDDVGCRGDDVECVNDRWDLHPNVNGLTF